MFTRLANRIYHLEVQRHLSEREQSYCALVYTTFIFRIKYRIKTLCILQKSGRVIPSEGTNGQYSNRRKMLVACKQALQAHNLTRPARSVVLF